MAGKDDKPRNGQPLDQIKLEDLEFDEAVKGVITGPLELALMSDIQRVTHGGSKWEFITNGLKDRGSEISADDRKIGLADLKGLYKFAIDNAPESPTATSPKKDKPSEPKYIASFGKSDYQHQLSASITGKASGENHGNDSRDSQSGVTCSIPLNTGENGVLDPIQALDFFHDVKLDIMIAAEDAKQGKLDGMEDERLPCYGVIEIGGPNYGKEHITFPVKLKGKMQHIDLARWAKSEIRLHFNIIEKQGVRKPIAIVQPDDPAQGKLVDAA